MFFKLFKNLKMIFRLPFKNKNISNIKKQNFKKYFLSRNILKISGFVFCFFIPFLTQRKLYSDYINNKIKSDNYVTDLSRIKWEKFNIEEKYKNEVIWKKIENNKSNVLQKKEVIKPEDLFKDNNLLIGSFNRSIVFNDLRVGPDISWLVPPGFKWNNFYKLDFSLRGNSG